MRLKFISVLIPIFFLSLYPTSATDLFEGLSRDVKLSIFSKLLIFDLLSCAQVSHDWRNHSSDNAVWRPLAIKYFHLPENGELGHFKVSKTALAVLMQKYFMIDYKKNLRN